MGCSITDEEGYRYFPDYPADKHHLSGASNFTLKQALHIYSFTPNCTGRIVGAEFCFHYQNITTAHTWVVFRLYEFKRNGPNFVPKNNFSSIRVIHALPIDRTQCISAESQQLEGLLCCARMTFYGNGPIPLTTGEELVFTILANNRHGEYPLLQYSTARPEFQVLTFEVDISKLPDGSSVLDHVYNSVNTKEEIATFPIMRFVVGKSILGVMIIILFC